MFRVTVALLSCAIAFAASAQPAMNAGSLEARIAEAASKNAFLINSSDGKFSGPGWDMLLAEGQSSQFFLLGEEHGIAENPQLAAALFKALVPDGYSHLVIETSPQMATALEGAARDADGMTGLRKLFADPTSNAAFFGMLEESEMLNAVVQSLPGQSRTLWGVDYEVLADRFLLAQLEAKPKNAVARDALAAIRTASTDSWEKYEETGGPQFIFSFAGDPSLVMNLRKAWPEADIETLGILNTLEETLAINQLWVQQQGWASNVRRAALMRSNFLHHWKQATASGRKPKVFFKLGSNHMVRGRNMTQTYDLGSLLPELAVLEGSKAFQLLVLPGKGTSTAVFDPTTMRFAPNTPKDDYAAGLETVTDQADPDTFTLIDLRPIRPLLSRAQEGISPKLMQLVHGYDAVLVMSGSTASHNLLDED